MSRVQTSMFPLFAANFFEKDEDVPVLEPVLTGRSVQPVSSAPRGPPAKSSSLRLLDLQNLPRDDGPPTELRTRKEKLAHFEQQCSHVGNSLFVGGEVVAKNREVLRQSHITHVVNCVGFLYPPYFEDDFAYQTLYLQDTPQEDILAVLYDVFDFIEGAAQSQPDPRIFIHCSQGVSRSTTLAIAYRMWREQRGYEDVFAEVKQMRGVANPNLGFICQLLQWHKRRTEEAHIPRLYRISPQSASAALYLVPKGAKCVRAALDPRGAFVLHDRQTVYLWLGSACPEAFAAAARRFADQLHRYEGAIAPAEVVHQGTESEAFWTALAEGAQASTPSTAAAPPPTLQTSDAAAGTPLSATERGQYDRDFELYARATRPGGDVSGRGDSCDSARSGRKTPRDQPEHAASPNDRLRKLARSEAADRELERTARSSGSSYGLGSESARARALDFQELAVRRRAPSPSALRPAPAGVPRLALPVAAQPAPAATPAEDDDLLDTSNSEDGAECTSDSDCSLTASEEDEGEAPAEGKRPMGVPRLNLG